MNGPWQHCFRDTVMIPWQGGRNELFSFVLRSFYGRLTHYDAFFLMEPWASTSVVLGHS